MASAIMHLCVAKKVNDILRKDSNLLYLGAIAPDLSKQIGETKYKSHFIDKNKEDDEPNIERFLKKYGKEMNKPYEIGYLIHLLTDKYWFGNYVYNFINKYNAIHETEGLNYTALKNIIYSDYTNLNIKLIDHYSLELYLFSNEIVYPKSKITEIPVKKLPIIIEKMGIILKNAQVDHAIMFDERSIIDFIEDCSSKIISDLESFGVYTPSSN